jgi:RNAse (barnase) inhibitor barstar
VIEDRLRWQLDRARAGPLRWINAAEVATLCAAGAAAGLHCARVDLSGREDKAGLLDALADALSFPEWFGRNWDALADCLGDLSWLPARGYLLVLEHPARLRARAARELDVALDILLEAAHDWAARDVPFHVFIAVGGANQAPGPRGTAP